MQPLLRPQPLGLTPWPHGGLLLPATAEARTLAEEVVRMGRDPGPRGGALAFWSAARADDPEGAREALGQGGTEEDDLGAYNDFVLSPTQERLDRLRTTLDGTLAALLEIAAYHSGLDSRLPEPAALDGELRAVARAALATRALETGDADTAIQELALAAQDAQEASPGLAAQLLLSLQEIQRSVRGLSETSIECLRKALALLGESGFDGVRAELQLELGGCLQETAARDPRRMTEAVALFQGALLHLDRERHRRAFGFAQMRLGLAYLSLPMRDAGDALRMGVATQALRESIDALSPQEEPELWCAAATNLANAYQILPSGHLSENLEQAIELYDRVLVLRPLETDPVGHARALVNRANAAATLERRSAAIADLTAALPILSRAGQTEELEAVRSMLDDLRRVAAGLVEETRP